MLADYVKEKWGKDPLTVVSPDSGRVELPTSGQIASNHPCRYSAIAIQSFQAPRFQVHELVGEVEQNHVVDDMVDTGRHRGRRPGLGPTAPRPLSLPPPRGLLGHYELSTYRMTQLIM